MSGKGFGDPGMYTRGIEQGLQPWPSLYEGAVGIGKDVKKETDGVVQKSKKVYRDYMKK
jgi:hypothetical protein